MNSSAGVVPPADPASPSVGLGVVLREWGRIGVIGFGGPPAHISLLRERVVDQRDWMSVEEFESAVATCNLLPGPASTQLAIYCAYRVAGRRGALVGGLAFIVPAVVVVLLLSLLFLSASPPRWVRGAGDGAGSAVAAVAASAALVLLAPSWRRARSRGRGRESRWIAYAVLGGASAALLGPYLVLVLLGCGCIELGFVLGLSRDRLSVNGTPVGMFLLAALSAGATGGVAALIWESLKVGALSYGGGFVIIPLMQHDAVTTYHWMSSSEFLNAVALGQVSPGPVVATVAAVGYAAHGIGGGILAAAVAFTPSFVFVLIGGPHFLRLRQSVRAQAFLDGSGPAAIGAIAGSAIPLAAALHHGWQFVVLACAAVALLVMKRGVVSTLLAAGGVGVIVALAGGPV
jgi:chromate transporter